MDLLSAAALDGRLYAGLWIGCGALLLWINSCALVFWIDSCPLVLYEVHPKSN
jgi:hypothetical protein